MPRAAALILAAAAVASCQSSRKRAPAGDSASAPPTDARTGESRASGAIAACAAAADRFVKSPEAGKALLVACAPLFGDASCRETLEAAARSPGVEAGMAAIVTCKNSYCPTYDLAELCEGKAPPTIRTARAQFPRLAAEVLQGEHGAALGTLDSLAYLMIKPLLPTQRRIYIRARAAGDAVTLAIGQKGWVGCKTSTTLRIAKSADLRALGGPLLKPLSALAEGVEPSLVEVLVDPEPGPRVKQVAIAAARFLVGRGMEAVTCFNDRANCPDVKSCP